MPQPAAPRARHRGVHVRRRQTARRPRCCTTSSTTRCCTRSIVFLSVVTEEVPHVTAGGAGGGRGPGRGVLPRACCATASWKTRTCPRRWPRCRCTGLDLSPGDTTYFLGRETLIPSRRRGWRCWREQLFAVMVAQRAHGHRRSSACRRTAWWSWARRSSCEWPRRSDGAAGGASGSRSRGRLFAFRQRFPRRAEHDTVHHRRPGRLVRTGDWWMIIRTSKRVSSHPGDLPLVDPHHPD